MSRDATRAVTLPARYLRAESTVDEPWPLLVLSTTELGMSSAVASSAGRYCRALISSNLVINDLFSSRASRPLLTASRSCCCRASLTTNDLSSSSLRSGLDGVKLLDKVHAPDKLELSSLISRALSSSTRVSFCRSSKTRSLSLFRSATRPASRRW